MAEIKIEGAPDKYRKYLKTADENGNNNGLIDNEDEAKAAAEALCKKTPADNCEEFLNYLEESEFKLPLKNSLLADSILKDLESNEPLIRSKAAGKSKELAKSAIPENLKIGLFNALIKLTADPEEEVRKEAISSLREYLDSDLTISIKAKMVEPLIKALQEKKDELRLSAVNSLAQLSETSITREGKNKIGRALLKYLSDENVEIRKTVTKTMSVLSESVLTRDINESIVEPLLNRLEDDKEIAVHAVKALAHLAAGDLSMATKIKMIDPLIKALESQIEAIKSQAAKGIIELSKLNLSWDSRAKLFTPLVRVLTEFEPTLGVEARKALKQLLGNLFSVKAPIAEKLKLLDAIIRLSINKDDDLRTATFKALETILKENPPIEAKIKILDTLLKGLEDQVDRIRLHAVINLGGFIISEVPDETKAKLVDPLIKALDDSEAEVVSQAAKNLGQLVALNIPAENKQKLAEALLKCLDSSEVNVKTSVSQALAILAKSDLPADEKEKLVAPLIKATESPNKQLKINAARALWSLYASNVSQTVKDKLLFALGQNFDVGKNKLTVLNFNIFLPPSAQDEIEISANIKNLFKDKYPVKNVKAGHLLSAHYINISSLLNLSSIDKLSPRESIIFAARVTKILTYGDKGSKYAARTIEERAQSLAQTIQAGQGVCHDHAELFLAVFGFLKSINKNLTNVYARYVGGRVSGYGMGHAWIMLMQAKSPNEFVISYIDPTWAKRDRGETLNAVDRTHFHVGIKAELYKMFGNKVLAMQMVKEYLAQNEKTEQSQIFNEIAYICRDFLKNTALADKYYQKVLAQYKPPKDINKMTEEETEAKNPLLEALYHLSEMRFKTKQYQKALAAYERFVAEFPEDFDTPYMLDKIAIIHLTQGDPDKALAVYNIIITKHHDHIMADDAYLAMSSIYLKYKVAPDQGPNKLKACQFAKIGAEKHPHGDQYTDLMRRIRSIKDCSGMKIDYSATQPASSPATQGASKTEAD